MHKRRKIQEAEYFYNQMQQLVSDYDAFVFNFSAFISAARTVIQYAYEEIKPKGKWKGKEEENWYKAQMSKPILKFFKKIRDANIHRQPTNPPQSATVHVHDLAMVTEVISIHKHDEQGNVIDETSPNPEPSSQATQPKQPEVEYRYTLQEWDGLEDILTLSQMYLDELRAFVDDGIAKGHITE